MATVLADNWWMLAFRGLAGVLFGIIAFFMPGAAITALALIFGAYVFVDGAFALISAIRGGRKQERWGALIAEGVLGLVAGAFTFFMPVVTVLALLFLVAAWAVVSGVLEIITAIRIRKSVRGEWILALAGIASVVFGILLWAAPMAGTIVLAWWIGAYALVFGVLQIALAFRLREWAKALSPVEVRRAA